MSRGASQPNIAGYHPVTGDERHDLGATPGGADRKWSVPSFPDRGCAVCGKAVCIHTDAEFSGLAGSGSNSFHALELPHD